MRRWVTAAVLPAVLARRVAQQAAGEVSEAGAAQRALASLCSSGGSSGGASAGGRALHQAPLSVPARRGVHVSGSSARATSLPERLLRSASAHGAQPAGSSQHRSDSDSQSWLWAVVAGVAGVAAAGAAGAGRAHCEEAEREFPPVWFGFELDFNAKYTLGAELGQGSYGKVHKCKCRKTGKELAVKVLEKTALRDSESIEDIDREVEILLALRGHENVVEVKGAYEDGARVYLVMDLCTGGDLYDRIDRGRLTEAEVASLVSQMLQALAHCHLKGVVLCDVKPDNFLFARSKHGEQLKAIDFGLSRRFTPGRALRRAAGTAYFVAPEVLRFEYGPESDLWSVGVIAHLLLTGRVPFDGATEKEILVKVARGEGLDWDGPHWAKVSPEAKALVKAMLNRDAGLRPSASAALLHPWFRSQKSMNRASAQQQVPLDAAVLAAMSSFASSGRMRKMAIRAMARSTAAADLEAVAHLKRQFVAMDEDGSGRISLEELKKVLQQSSLKYTDAEIQQMLQDLDMSGEGTINYLEFVAAAMSLHQLHSESSEEFMRLARIAFDKFDLDKSGYFTADELKEALKTTCTCYAQGSEVTDKMVADLMAQVDTNGDGKVTFEEFLALLHINGPSTRSRYGWIKTPQ